MRQRCGPAPIRRLPALLHGDAPMRYTDHEIEQAPFAQIANGTLRDRRLSLKARGLLAMVLSYPEDWDAPRDWLVEQCDKDGKEAIQSALNELTALGYREVTKRQDEAGRWRSVVVWRQEPRRPDNPAGGSSGDNRTLFPNTKEDGNVQVGDNTDARQAARFSDEDELFDCFWGLAIHKTGKQQARAAFAKAATKADIRTVIGPAWRQANEAWATWTEDQHGIPYPATWLNQERWTDGAVPQRAAKRGKMQRADAVNDLVDDLSADEVLARLSGVASPGPNRKELRS